NLAALIVEALDELARQPDRRDHPLPHTLSGSRRQGGVEIRAVEQRDLEQLSTPRNRTVLEEMELQQHRDIRPDREVTECQRAAEVRVRLIGGADEEQEEEPAAIASGQV